MDHTNPQAPQIKNLNNFIDMYKKKRKIIEDSTHHNDFYFTGESQANQKGGNNSSAVTGDIFASFGQAYKTKFKKMIGQGGRSSKSAVVINKDSNNNAESKHVKNVTEASLREMRMQGSQQYGAEHKKKPGLSYFINKTDEMFGSKPGADMNRECKARKAYLNETEFQEMIDFKFGLPLIVFDFVDYMVGSDLITEVQKYVNPQTHIDRFDTSNQEFNELKLKVDEEFLPYIFQLFNALGAIDLRDLDKNAQ